MKKRRIEFFERCLAAMKLFKEGKISSQEFFALTRLEPLSELTIDYKLFKSEKEQVRASGFSVPLTDMIQSRRKELKLPSLTEVVPEDVERIFKETEKR